MLITLAGAAAGPLSTGPTAAQFQAAYRDVWTDVRGAPRRLTLVPESELRVMPQIRGGVLGGSASLNARQRQPAARGRLG